MPTPAASINAQAMDLDQQNDAPHAGRPRFALTDEQARSLVQQIDAINARHANNLRQHRPFVHDFVRAVYHATGKTYSAGIYRKLLTAYAPGRTPSTPTIETEKNLLEHDLRRRAVPREVFHEDTAVAVPGPAPASPGGVAAPAELAQLEILGLLQHLAGRVDQLDRTPASADRSAGLQAHNDYLCDRLVSVEAELATTRTLAARMTATAQEEASLAAERGRQLAAQQASIEAMTTALAQMAASIDGDRQFFAMQVDGVRGETRAVRERCTQLEALVKEKEQQAEMYRRMAYSKGAAQ